MTKRLQNALYYFLTVLTVLASIIALQFLKLYDFFCIILDIIVPIVFGYVLAWALNPLYKKISKKIGAKLSIIVLIIAVIGLYTGLILQIVPILIGEANNFIDIIKSYIPKLKELPLIDINENFFELKVDAIVESCGGMVSIVVNFALIHMFAFYILYNYDSIKSFVKKHMPSKYKIEASKFTRKLSIEMYQYIKGTLIDMAILFLMASILFIAFRFKYAVLIALFIAITNAIPFVGPYIGGIPAVLLGFAVNVKMGIIALVIVIILQAVESNLINPIIMSKCTKINPLLIVIGITIMGKILGIIGMAFAVPTLIFLKNGVDFIKKYREKNVEMKSFF